MSDQQPPTWKNFLTLWVGQVVSLFGSGLTGFALGVWVFQQTGSTTDFALIYAFGAIPGLLVAPFAGVLIDHWNRRWILVLSDLTAALGTVILIALLWAEALTVWHVYAIVILGASAMAVQRPAYHATVTLLVPKKHFARAAGMQQFGQSGAQILAPLAAGFLLPVIALRGIIVIDLVTFLVGVAAVLAITIPRVERPAHDPAAGPRPNVFRLALVGWTYIKERPALVDLVLFFAAINLFFAFSLVLVTPLVLSFASATELGFVLAVGSAGALLGSLVITAWGGPRRAILGVLGFSPMLGLSFLVVGLRPSVTVVAIGVFFLFLVVPMINSSNRAIWQSKVEPAVQGRVFAVSQLVSQFTAPIAFLAAGPLADGVFRPLLEPGGALADSVGRWIGVGPGRGIGLLFLVMGALLVVASVAGLLHPRLRRLDDHVPDAVHEAAPAEA